jgi:uncharacterized protein YlxP (DUF503 family)
MVVGVLTLKLMVPGSHSLKDKRRALRGIKDRLRSQFNVSVAEVDAHDVWQTAVLGVAAVGVDRAYVEGLLDSVISLVRNSGQVVLARCDKEFV